MDSLLQYINYENRIIPLSEAFEILKYDFEEDIIAKNLTIFAKDRRNEGFPRIKVHDWYTDEQWNNLALNYRVFYKLPEFKLLDSINEFLNGINNKNHHLIQYFPLTIRVYRPKLIVTDAEYKEYLIREIKERLTPERLSEFSESLINFEFVNYIIDTEIIIKKDCKKKCKELIIEKGTSCCSRIYNKSRNCECIIA